MNKDTPWREAILTVMQKSSEPMHYTDITEQILVAGLRTSYGATPESTVNAFISDSIKKLGNKSPFLRVGNGLYALQNSSQTPKITEKDEQDTIIRAFGMYWKRDEVLWKNTPILAGKQLTASSAIDFYKQIGIYILYDNHDVIYVGRSIDRPLGQRLFEHTIDRLSGRWNRFSWFGMYAAKDDSSLAIADIKPNVDTLIATFEALLIETLEPPQNRKRGDGLNAIEYIQAEDPNLKARQEKELLYLIQRRLTSES